VSPLKKNVDKLEIFREGKKLVLERAEAADKPGGAGEWKVVEPIEYPANDRQVRSLISRLERLEFWEVLTENREDFDDLAVSEEKGTRLRVFAKEDLLADMIVGKAITAKLAGRSQSYTAVRKQGSGKVWKVIGSLKYIFDKPLSRWRDSKILDLKRDRLAALAVIAEDGSFVAATRDPEEKDRAKKQKNWKLAASKPEFQEIDQTELGRMGSSISRLRAKGFADEAKPEETGLAKPFRKVVVVYKAKAAKKPEKGAKKPREGAKGKKKGAGEAVEAGDGAKEQKEKTEPPVAAATPVEAGTGPTGVAAIDSLIKRPGYEAHVVLIGKEEKKQKARYVKLEDKKQVFLVRETALANALKDIAQLRDKTVVKVDPSNVVGIEVRHEKGTTVLKREKVEPPKKKKDQKDEKGKKQEPATAWKVVKPKSLQKEEIAVDRVVKMLESRFRARSFANTADPEKTGLRKPVGRVILRLAKGPRITILVGKEAEKNRRYVQVQGKPEVYVMGSYPLSQLYKPPLKWKKPKRPQGMGRGRRRRGGVPPSMIRRRRMKTGR
jgi:hypothetical protein